MAKRTYRINATIGVPDESKDRPALFNRHGSMIRPPSKGTRFIAPNEPIVLEDVVGDHFVAKHGGTSEAAPTSATRSKPAKDADKE